MTPTVLLYNFTSSRWAALFDLCAKQGVRTVRVPAGEQGKAIGALLGLPVPPRPQTGPGTVPGELMVLSGFSSRTLDAFLDAFPAAGVPSVPMKAVTTAQNLAWSGVELYGELWKERQAAGEGR